MVTENISPAKYILKMYISFGISTKKNSLVHVICID